MTSLTVSETAVRDYHQVRAPGIPLEDIRVALVELGERAKPTGEHTPDGRHEVWEVFGGLRFLVRIGRGQPVALRVVPPLEVVTNVED